MLAPSGSMNYAGLASNLRRRPLGSWAIRSGKMLCTVN